MDGPLSNHYYATLILNLIYHHLFSSKFSFLILVSVLKIHHIYPS